jgi:hypothetical protein
MNPYSKITIIKNILKNKISMARYLWGKTYYSKSRAKIPNSTVKKNWYPLH